MDFRQYHCILHGMKKYNSRQFSRFLNFIQRPMENENGTVLVVAIMILALLTVLGIAGLNTTSTEIKVAANDKVYKQAFYNSDSGVSYAVEAGFDIFPKKGPGSWHSLPAIPADLPSGVTLEYWDYGGSPRRIAVRSTGTAPGGGNSVIIAGILAITLSAQKGLGNETDY